MKSLEVLLGNRHFCFIISFYFFLLYSNNSIGQKTDFDPFKLEASFFNNSEVKNGLTFTEGHERFKIDNSSRSKGVKIFANGSWLKHGIFYSFRSNQTLLSSSTYNYGDLEGERIQYFENGNVQYIHHYRNNKKDGNWKQYASEGYLNKEGNYIKNLKEGEELTYMNNGNILYRSNFKNDQLDGEQIQYKGAPAKGGEIYKTEIWNDGVKVSSKYF